MSLLSQDEMAVLDHLVAAWNGFVRLPLLHPHERQEFMSVMHEAQRIVMARPVMREMEKPTDAQ